MGATWQGCFETEHLTEWLPIAALDTHKMQTVVAPKSKGHLLA